MRSNRGHGRVWTALIAGAVALGVAAPSASADTVVVTVMNGSLSNDGECSVREAVNATNANAAFNGADDCDHSGSTGPDTIKLPVGTAAISGAASENLNATGDLDIKSGEDLTIVGKGAGQSKLDGDVDRVIDQLGTGDKLTLRKLTVQDGDAGAGQGGDVQAKGKLTLDHVTIRDGVAAFGGGVRAIPGGKLVMTKSLVTNNTATGPQGGGGIHAGVAVTITDSEISDNMATGSFGPGGMRIEGGPSTITGSTFSGNSSAQGAGGAIEVTSGMSPRNLTITETLITQNHADSYRGGGIYYGGAGVLKITHSLFSLNSARSGGGGIEAVNDADTLKLSKSIVSNNTLSSTAVEIIGGAAIAADGKSTISQSEIVGNIATSPNEMADGFGGAIRNGGKMRITRSTLFDNQSPDGSGGGVYQDGTGAKLTISNSTFNENSASSRGGAIRSSLAADLHIYNSTFSVNSAGGDGQAIYAEGTGAATVQGSIFANSPPSGACQGGNLVSKGYNVDVGSSCALGGPHDLTDMNPKLRDYDNYGGPIAGTDGIATQLHLYPIKKSSPAKNLIPKKKCKDDKGKLKTDEISNKRPGGKKCDAGAFEA
jgi:predicted outer membrane repeat protein